MINIKDMENLQFSYSEEDVQSTMRLLCLTEENAIKYLEELKAAKIAKYNIKD